MNLEQLKNLGPVSAGKLQDTGIESVEQLRRLGAVEAYLRVKQSQENISLNMLYALHGALTDRHWQRIDAEDRAALLLEVDARQAMSADDQPVENLKNIGKTLAGRLAGIGIRTLGELQKMGTVEAYRRMQAKRPVNLPVCYNLYALEGAMRGCHWDDLPDETKDELYLQAKGRSRPGFSQRKD